MKDRSDRMRKIQQNYFGRLHHAEEDAGGDAAKSQEALTFGDEVISFLQKRTRKVLEEKLESLDNENENLDLKMLFQSTQELTDDSVENGKKLSEKEKRKFKIDAIVSSVNDPEAEKILFEIIKRKQEREVDDGIFFKVKNGFKEMMMNLANDK